MIQFYICTAFSPRPHLHHPQATSHRQHTRLSSSLNSRFSKNIKPERLHKSPDRSAILQKIHCWGAWAEEGEGEAANGDMERRRQERKVLIWYSCFSPLFCLRRRARAQIECGENGDGKSFSLIESKTIEEPIVAGFFSWMPLEFISASRASRIILRVNKGGRPYRVD